MRDCTHRCSGTVSLFQPWALSMLDRHASSLPPADRKQLQHADSGLQAVTQG